MSEELNPYAPPKSLEMPVINETDDTVWQEHGNKAVSVNKRVFPPRCIKCNQPAHGSPIRVKLSWHHSWIYLLILFNVLFYIITALIFSKRAVTYIGLCEKHKKKLKWGRQLGWGGFVLIITGLSLGAALDQEIILRCSLIALVPWLIGTVMLTRTVRASNIQKETIVVSGCGRAFLDSLPQYDGQLSIKKAEPDYSSF